MLNSKPTISYAIPYFDETGAMRAPYLICKGFVDAGWNVEIATISSPENANIDLAWDHVPVRKLDGFSKKAKLLKLAAKLLKRRDDHIVLTWVWNWHCFALMISKILFNSPYALALDTYTHFAPWDTNSLLSKLRLELRYGLVMRNSDVILAESPLCFEHARRYIKRPQILLVPICFWESDLREIETCWAAQNYGPQREPIIFYAGQIVERKNIHDLIKAFSHLSERFSEWRLEIRGPVSDSSYLASLQNLATLYGLDDRIDFLPGLSGESLYRRYRSTSIYCLPSSFEGMPTTILEAMYFGGAIVAGTAGHVSYQLDDGNCGLLFHPGDVDCLTKHLETLMGSETKREDYMNKARERLLQLFTWEKYFGSIEKSLRHLVER
jgi:glycosyltransferase involved in cell wall biosynthesis